MTFERLHHVQLAMPRGQEAAGRAFFVDVLGMTEIPDAVVRLRSPVVRRVGR